MPHFEGPMPLAASGVTAPVSRPGPTLPGLPASTTCSLTCAALLTRPELSMKLLKGTLVVHHDARLDEGKFFIESFFLDDARLFDSVLPAILFFSGFFFSHQNNQA